MRLFFPCFLAVLLVAGSSLAAMPVRLATVPIPVDNGLLEEILPDFSAETGWEVEVYAGTDVIDRAEAGEADLVIAHWGFAALQDFVEKGRGHWPEMVFFSSSALIGPSEDPAGLRNADSVPEALKRLAGSGYKLYRNKLSVISAQEQLFFDLAGFTGHEDWIEDSGTRGEAAVLLAAQNQGYVFWGAVPFLELQKQQPSGQDLIITDDPVLPRIMSVVRVNPEQVSGVNSEGANALTEYLMRSSVQARIATYKAEGVAAQLWWPGAVNNDLSGAGRR